MSDEQYAPTRPKVQVHLYLEPNAAQLVQMTEQVAAGTLKLAPEPLPPSEGPAAFARVVSGRAGGKKIVLTGA